jgi:hypothetical protein
MSNSLDNKKPLLRGLVHSLFGILPLCKERFNNNAKSAIKALLIPYCSLVPIIIHNNILLSKIQHTQYYLAPNTF